MAEKIYYKPHYGPEETKDLIEWEQNRQRAQKKFIEENLKMQMDHKDKKKQREKINERVSDLVNLNVVY